MQIIRAAIYVAKLDWPLYRPVSDIFLHGLFDVFTALIGNCLVSSPQRKLVAGKLFPTVEHMSQPFSRVRSQSNCSHSDNLLLQIPTTSIHASLTISSRRAPKLQYLAKAYIYIIHKRCNWLSLFLSSLKETYSVKNYVSLLHEVWFKLSSYCSVWLLFIIRQPKGF